MKRDKMYLLVGVIFFLMSIFCAWYVTYQVIPSSVENTLRHCMFWAGVLGGFSLGSYIFSGDK